jgi:carboxyl-terminal processing protease
MPFLLLLALSVAPAPQAAPVAPAAPVARPSDPAAGDLVAEVDALVRARFLSPSRLPELGWDGAVATARSAFSKTSDPAARTAVLRELLATLRTSHTGYYPRTDPAFWDLASIFEPVLARTCAKDRAPPLPVTSDAVGVFWRQLEGRWFVGGLYAGGPAEQAGLLTGDEVVTAGGAPFGPVVAFAGKAGTPVALEVRRTHLGPTLAVPVTPISVRPVEALRQAVAASFRVVERGNRKLAYLRVWAWTSPELQQAVLQGIARANEAGVDGYVLDLRDGWGGASPHDLSIFMKEVPVLEGIAPDGAVDRFDAQLRKPTVVLVNGGTRSGKEMLAFAIRRHSLARLVGERTAGAVVYGAPFCLSDGALLLLAVTDARVDGERLEGRGVAPDVEVPWDLRHAAGRDPQLERALQLLAGA